MTAKTRHALGKSVLQVTGAKPKSQVSAAQFFAQGFFAALGSKRYAYPEAPATARCFSCGARNQRRWRFDEVTLARKCEGCRTRKRKRTAVVEVSEEGRIRAQVLLHDS